MTPRATLPFTMVVTSECKDGSGPDRNIQGARDPDVRGVGRERLHHPHQGVIRQSDQQVARHLDRHWPADAA